MTSTASITSVASMTYMLTRAELLIHLCYETPCIALNNWLKFLYKNINRWQDKHMYMFTLCNSLLKTFPLSNKKVCKNIFRYLCSCNSFSSYSFAFSISKKCRPLSQFLWHSHFSLQIHQVCRLAGSGFFLDF